MQRYFKYIIFNLTIKKIKHAIGENNRSDPSLGDDFRIKGSGSVVFQEQIQDPDPLGNQTDNINI